MSTCFESVLKAEGKGASFRHMLSLEEHRAKVLTEHIIAAITVHYDNLTFHENCIYDWIFAK